MVRAVIVPPLAEARGRIVTYLLKPDDWRLSRNLRLAALADRDAPLFGDLRQETSWDASRWREELETIQWVAAMYGDDPAGIAKVVDYPAEDPRLHLESMWVTPRYRRRGIGNRLLQEAEAFTRSKGQQRLGLWVLEGNQAARKLYLNAGYRPTGRLGKIMNELNETEFARSISSGAGRASRDSPPIATHP
jgi:GNAT superfamily N-acetyltransferase